MPAILILAFPLAVPLWVCVYAEEFGFVYAVRRVCLIAFATCYVRRRWVIPHLNCDWNAGNIVFTYNGEVELRGRVFCHWRKNVFNGCEPESEPEFNKFKAFVKASVQLEKGLVFPTFLYFCFFFVSPAAISKTNGADAVLTSRLIPNSVSTNPHKTSALLMKGALTMKYLSRG